MRADKAFQIPYIIQVDEGCEQKLNHLQIQINQKSDINVILTVIVKQLKLLFYSLSDVSFTGLTIKTADY